jgi:thioesterase domain-containing protein
VYVLQAKGLDGSKPFESVEETARCYVEEIRKVQPHGPYQLSGMSYGSLVAFEMARVLEEMGEPVGALFLIDCMNPAFAKMMPKTELIWRLTSFSLWRLGIHAKHLLSLKPGEWGGYVSGPVKAMNRYGRGLVRKQGRFEDTGPQFDRDWERMKTAEGTRLGEILERVGKASRDAGAKFVPKRYRGDAIVIRARDHWPTPYEDDCLGWKLIIQGKILPLEVEGGHDSMFQVPEEVRVLAEMIDAHLSKSGVGN